jgi:hypothetical protein
MPTEPALPPTLVEPPLDVPAPLLDVPAPLLDAPAPLLDVPADVLPVPALVVALPPLLVPAELAESSPPELLPHATSIETEQRAKVEQRADRIFMRVVGAIRMPAPTWLELRTFASSSTQYSSNDPCSLGGPLALALVSK